MLHLPSWAGRLVHCARLWTICWSQASGHQDVNEFHWRLKTQESQEFEVHSVFLQTCNLGKNRNCQKLLEKKVHWLDMYWLHDMSDVDHQYTNPKPSNKNTEKNPNVNVSSYLLKSSDTTATKRNHLIHFIQFFQIQSTHQEMILVSIYMNLLCPNSALKGQFGAQVAPLSGPFCWTTQSPFGPQLVTPSPPTAVATWFLSQGWVVVS